MNVKPAVAVAALLALNGCAVGIVSVHAPARLPAEGLPPLTQRVSFDVCKAGDSRSLKASLIGEALSRAGVQADLVSEPGMPARFTATLREKEERYGWSAVLSVLTLSIIPGYFADRYSIEVDVALRHSGKGGGLEHLVYERGVSYFNWAPIIVHPDYVGIFDAMVWESPRSKEVTKKAEAVGFEETIQRLADDLRLRLGRESPESPTTEVVGVTCPLPSQEK